MLPKNEGLAHVNELVLGEDADTRFWLMEIRWLVRGQFGYVELAEFMTFLFLSNMDLASITFRSIPLFKRFDQHKPESKNRGKWKGVAVGGDLKIAFRYCAGEEAVASLYAESANFEGDDFEWLPKRLTSGDELLYSTHAIGRWWAPAQVSDEPAYAGGHSPLKGCAYGVNIVNLLCRWPSR